MTLVESLAIFLIGHLVGAQIASTYLFIFPKKFLRILFLDTACVLSAALFEGWFLLLALGFFSCGGGVGPYPRILFWAIVVPHSANPVMILLLSYVCWCVFFLIIRAMCGALAIWNIVDSLQSKESAIVYYNQIILAYAAIACA